MWFWPHTKVAKEVNQPPVKPPLEAAIAKDQICELGSVIVDRLTYGQDALVIAICF